MPGVSLYSILFLSFWCQFVSDWRVVLARMVFIKCSSLYFLTFLVIVNMMDFIRDHYNTIRVSWLFVVFNCFSVLYVISIQQSYHDKLYSCRYLIFSHQEAECEVRAGKLVFHVNYHPIFAGVGIMFYGKPSFCTTFVKIVKVSFWWFY